MLEKCCSFIVYRVNIISLCSVLLIIWYFLTTPHWDDKEHTGTQLKKCKIQAREMKIMRRLETKWWGNLVPRKKSNEKYILFDLPLGIVLLLVSGDSYWKRMWLHFWGGKITSWMYKFRKITGTYFTTLVKCLYVMFIISKLLAQTSLSGGYKTGFFLDIVEELFRSDPRLPTFIIIRCNWSEYTQRKGNTNMFFSVYGGAKQTFY